MNLYLLRHGIAEDRALGKTDAERRLTPEGIAEMEREARGMVALNLHFDAIFSSPYPRAYETAVIVQRALELPEVVQDERLSAGRFRLGALQALAQNAPAQARLLFVGHEPDLSVLVQDLTGAAIEMKKGGLACVETVRPEPNYGVLNWLLTPKILKALGAP